jgi:Major Facilitator Superfamily
MASAIVFPAAAALTPLTVPSRMLQEANAVLRLGLNAALIVGTASGGLLVGTLGSGWGLAIDAAAYVVAAGRFARLRHRVGGPDASRREPGLAGVVSDLRDGWREVSSRTWLWAVVLAFGFANAAPGRGAEHSGRRRQIIRP